MHLIARLMAALGWPPPAVHVPKARVRRMRATCEFCGRSIAITRSGKLYGHICHPPDMPEDDA